MRPNRFRICEPPCDLAGSQMRIASVASRRPTVGAAPHVGPVAVHTLGRNARNSQSLSSPRWSAKPLPARARSLRVPASSVPRSASQSTPQYNQPQAHSPAPGAVIQMHTCHSQYARVSITIDWWPVLQRGHVTRCGGEVNTCQKSASRVSRYRSTATAPAPPGSAESTRRQWARADGVVLSHARVAKDARPPDGETGVDNEMAERGFDRNRARGFSDATCSARSAAPWPDDSWKGWWGEEPPYHTPVFVLTHHARPPLRMAGGTEFRFVTGGIEAALAQARAAAGGPTFVSAAASRPSGSICAPG